MRKRVKEALVNGFSCPDDFPACPGEVDYYMNVYQVRSQHHH